MVEFEMVNDIRHCELENKKRIGQLRGGRDRGIYIDCVTWFAAGGYGIPTQNSMYAHTHCYTFTETPNYLYTSS